MTSRDCRDLELGTGISGTLRSKLLTKQYFLSLGSFRNRKGGRAWIQDLSLLRTSLVETLETAVLVTRARWALPPYLDCVIALPASSPSNPLFCCPRENQEANTYFTCCVADMSIYANLLPCPLLFLLKMLEELGTHFRARG